MDFTVFDHSEHMTALTWLGRKDWMMYQDIPAQRAISARPRKLIIKPRQPVEPGPEAPIVVGQKEYDRYPADMWKVLAGKRNPKPVTKKRIIKEFKQHPSVPIVGIVKFWESDWAQITCLLQGQQEIQAWLQSPEAQELSGIVKSIGAEAITVSGIHVT